MLNKKSGHSIVDFSLTHASKTLCIHQRPNKEHEVIVQRHLFTSTQNKVATITSSFSNSSRAIATTLHTITAELV